jgi:DMSO reductase anchor subunit
MLVFTQLGVGGSIVTTWGNLEHPWLSLVNVATFGIGLFFSAFHLGQPLKAWRVWLGWRTSWLSREAIALNAFATCLVWQVIGGHIPKWILLCAGTIAVFSQVMVYADTQRQFWAVERSLPRFFGSVFVLGSATALAFQPTFGMGLMLLAGTIIKLGCELAVLKYKDDEDRTSLQLRRTATLQTGLLRPMLTLRLMLGFFSGMFIPFLFLTSSAGTSFLFASLLLCLGVELAERYLFFTSVAPDRMPGNPGS